MSLDNSDEVGFPAAPTRVYQTSWRKRSGERSPRNRKIELFPVRYDRRPLHVRALERRAEAALR